MGMDLPGRIVVLYSSPKAPGPRQGNTLTFACLFNMYMVLNLVTTLHGVGKINSAISPRTFLSRSWSSTQESILMDLRRREVPARHSETDRYPEDTILEEPYPIPLQAEHADPCCPEDAILRQPPPIPLQPADFGHHSFKSPTATQFPMDNMDLTTIEGCETVTGAKDEEVRCTMARELEQFRAVPDANAAAVGATPSGADLTGARYAWSPCKPKTRSWSINRAVGDGAEMPIFGGLSDATEDAVGTEDWLDAADAFFARGNADAGTATVLILSDSDRNGDERDRLCQSRHLG